MISKCQRSILRFALFSAMVGVIVSVHGEDRNVDRERQWKKVDEAVKKGLPKTAIQELEPIIRSTLAEKAYPEAIKAVAKKIALEGTIEGNKPEERIVRLKAEIAKAPKEMTPVLDAILAHWYWNYFQANRYRFHQRTATAEAPGEDFTTWDLSRLFATIDAQFTKALANEKELQAIPIATYDALLVKGTMSDDYRPTLWDFLVHDSLSFYTAGEQAGAQGEDAFTLSADSPIFGSVDDFLKWQPKSDSPSQTIKAIELYQKLLTFYQKEAEPTAFADADFSRLNFGHNLAVGEEKTARYKAALKTFAEHWANNEISAIIRHHWAEVVQPENPAEARSIAIVGRNIFANSPGGKMCHNLIAQIEAKSASISTERVWANPLPVVRVRYRNVTKVYFRLVQADYLAFVKSDRYRPENISSNDRRMLLGTRPAAEFAHDLPATADYKERTENVAIPKGVRPGFYFLVASHDPQFSEANNQISVCDVWVSDLAIVTRQAWGAGKIEGFVLNNNTGEPIAGAEVRTWQHISRNRWEWKPGATLRTDANGMFRVEGVENGSHLLLASHGGHQLSTGDDVSTYRGGRKDTTLENTTFFTDRSIYRPGQTIRYKGLCIRADYNTDSYQTIANRDVTVVFYDPNRKEIARHKTRTNDYGSFNGSFTAPRDRLTGQMTIQIDGTPRGAASIHVEEYKRPKFQVTLDGPAEAAKLNAPVTVIGKALSYTGIPISGAKVRYRVVREVRYPIWWHDFYWWRPMPQGNAQEITHGTATTEANGTFSITFTARPDAIVPEKDEPSFQFAIDADVTDTTGETRSGSKSVEVGYTALRAAMVINEWQTVDHDVELAVTTNTLNGDGQAAKGTIKIHHLKQPAQVVRPPVASRHWEPPGEKSPDASNPKSWELGELAIEQKFETDAVGKAKASAKLGAGIYRAILETQDRFGKPVTARAQILVVDPAATKFAVKIPEHVAAPNWSFEPGQEFVALWGTGYDRGRAFIEIEHRGKLLQAFWTDPAKTQVSVKQAINESMRGGFSFRVTYVRENRAYLSDRRVGVPWSNKELAIKWERFTSKLEPGKKETWTAVVTGPGAKTAAAEMVAALYDQSLDAFLPHEWLKRIGVFRQDHSQISSSFENQRRDLQHLFGQWRQHLLPVDLRYRAFPADLVDIWDRRSRFFNARSGGGGPMAPSAGIEVADEAPAKNPAGPAGTRLGAVLKEAEAKPDDARTATLPDAGKAGSRPPGPGLSQVAARSNLSETAFFFPQLVSGDDGSVRIEFTMPETLTKWKFQSFAHDRELRSGSLTAEVVSAKDLMVVPNPPRFLREGDRLEFTVKVSNRSATRQAGQARLSFNDMRTSQAVDAALGVGAADQTFDLAAGESKTFSWTIAVPDGLGPVSFKAVAATERLSDGEEGGLPVLSRRVLVTESLPLPIRGEGSKTFTMPKLVEAGKSDTLRSQSLTVQAVSQPAWYAVLALPYLMEFPHECTEQTFNRLYANALARHIAQSDPKIRRIFDQWRDTPALDSPLEKNQDLKAVMLEETPWLRQELAESQARRNVGVLFDNNRLNDETDRMLRKLAEQQREDGTWPWFPGGPHNDYITLYITTGFGRMRHLGVKIDTASALKSLTRLDGWMNEQYLRAQKHKPEENHLSSTIALYLYGRSFFLTDRPIDKGHQPALNYWLGQAKKYWLKLSRQSQGHLAIALTRFGDAASAKGIMASIKEHSVSNEEMGTFWRDTEHSWWWYHAPIETQALMIEAFDEVNNDRPAVEDCKVWLIKQKQTQDWKTTKATADAVYALMLRGENLLKSDALLEVSLGGKPVKPEKVEAGTGFYEQKFIRAEVTPELGQIVVKKTDPGVSWASLHWQYLEDVSKVTPYEGTPLKLEKKLFKRVYTKTGPTLEAVAGPVAVGDEIVTRVILRTDRDMEYIHLRDHRGSGTEPVNVLSQYRYQDGLAYYESTKDTASHFFIDYLPKGIYVFEYAVRVQHKGNYPTGLAEIQCMYAPEFNSHSESVQLEVK